MRRALRVGASSCLLVMMGIVLITQFNGIYIIKGWHNVYVVGNGAGYWRDASWDNWSTVQILPAGSKWVQVSVRPSLEFGTTPSFFVPWWLVLPVQLLATGAIWRCTGSPARRPSFPLETTVTGPERFPEKTHFPPV